MFYKGTCDEKITRDHGIGIVDARVEYGLGPEHAEQLRGIVHQYEQPR